MNEMQNRRLVVFEEKFQQVDSRPRRFARTGTDLPMDEREAGGGQGPRVQPLEEVLVGQVWTKEEDLNLVLYYVTNFMQ